MRHVYDNQEEAKERGMVAQRYVRENFSAEVIGNKIIDAIESL
jgi:hypothetical protein